MLAACAAGGGGNKRLWLATVGKKETGSPDTMHASDGGCCCRFWRSSRAEWLQLKCHCAVRVYVHALAHSHGKRTTTGDGDNSSQKWPGEEVVYDSFKGRSTARESSGECNFTTLPARMAWHTHKNDNYTRVNHTQPGARTVGVHWFFPGGTLWGIYAHHSLLRGGNSTLPLLAKANNFYTTEGGVFERR